MKNSKETSTERPTSSSSVSRRSFLETGARNAAGVAAGLVGISHAQASECPSETLRVGVIGIRNQGLKLARIFAAEPNVDVTAICDVDQSQFSKALSQLSELQKSPVNTETDFRRILDSSEIDVVVIATPDHWHSIQTIMACQAGKDVYVEQPVSLSVREGETMKRAAKHYQRIVQTGLQERSGTHFQSAIRLVQSGQLGKVKLAKAWATHRRSPIGFRNDSSSPDHLDYDMWLGPAPKQNFNANRYHQNWRWFWDYGSGELGQWGVHLLDVARWGMNVSLPERIAASGGKYYIQDQQETPDTLSVQFSFADATLIWEHYMWSPQGLEGRSAAVAFYGDQGTLIVDRGGWKIYGQKPSQFSESTPTLVPHARNFLFAVRSRTEPNANLETGCSSASLCHLGNIAYRLKRELCFSEEQMNFGKDFRANHYLRRTYREPWKLPTV